MSRILVAHYMIFDIRFELSLNRWVRTLSSDILFTYFISYSKVSQSTIELESFNVMHKNIPRLTNDLIYEYQIRVSF